MSPTESYIQCIDWDISRIDDIRLNEKLSDQASAQLNGIRQHLEQLKAFLEESK